MPAKKIKCDYCDKLFWASRSDSLYCSEKCQARTKRESRKFETPIIPNSSIEGITFNRFRRKWEVRVKLYGEWKYIGANKDFEKAKILRNEILCLPQIT